MKIILSATDFSKNGNNAVEYAATLASEFGARLILINVYERPDKPKEAINSNMEKETRIVSEKKLSSLKNKVSAKYKNVIVEYHFVSDINAADAINNFANKLQTDLIVLGSTGTNKMERILMGSTSSKIIHLAKYPVLCIPKEAIFQGIQRIVFATDLKDESLNDALSMITFASHFKAEICFLFVDDKNVIHSDEAVLNMTQKIRRKVHYTKISGYITNNTNIIKGIEYFLKKNKSQVLVMVTHFKNFPSVQFSQSITAMMSDRTQIPLLALKSGVVSLKTL